MKVRDSKGKRNVRKLSQSKRERMRRGKSRSRRIESLPTVS